jgi:hypothetical protein
VLASGDVEVVEPWGMPCLARVTVTYLKMQRKHMQRAWLRLTKPFMANDVAARQEKLGKGLGGDGTGRVTLRDSTPKGERRQMTHDKRIVANYERCCLGGDNHLQRDASIGDDIATLRQKTKEWLARQLEFEVLKFLRTGSKTRRI